VVLPRELLNTKPVFAPSRNFFGTSQLSQFMDQTNALAETTTSGAYRPGSRRLERERRASKSATSILHYGRICRSKLRRSEHRPDLFLTTYAR